MKKIFCMIIALCALPALNACSLYSNSAVVEEPLTLSFAEKIALAPVNQPFMMAESTPFGSNLTFLVEETYTSALGTVCRQATVENMNKSFVVCNQNKNPQEKAHWVLVPAIQ